jgi:hypothetical protein
MAVYEEEANLKKDWTKPCERRKRILKSDSGGVPSNNNKHVTCNEDEPVKKLH